MIDINGSVITQERIEEEITKLQKRNHSIQQEKAEVVMQKIQMDAQVECIKKKIKEYENKSWWGSRWAIGEKEVNQCAPWLNK